ncbi:uncharacterized protein J7T54_001378 [Emericellopsis cladophorae]|uniref:Tetraspanin n=1 Tax=Emericellopsis cladophorae TaxID=2686198 RepID=A0A9P9Y365_9HYPO|nr:uncharacterized protein J7T54_001378 [Emericellopsis cladophorae]KAI6782521.1 hypothetical protein J7T54_001378 [Emericellopsis cladophorae]
MANKILLTAALVNVLVMASGVLILVASLVIRSQANRPMTDGPSVLCNLIFVRLPLDAGIANGVFILIASVFSLPGLLMQSTRGWLKLYGYMVTVCGLFTMCLGVYLWIMTLKIGEGFQSVYEELDPDLQSLIQTDFQCCGYINSTTPAFVTDPVCPSPAAAALLRGCQAAVSSFANTFLDKFFTAVFGVVGLDTVSVLATAALSKDRKDKQWYRRLDSKGASW